MKQLQGTLSTVIKEQENRLLALLVPIEAALDFPEDEISTPERASALEEVRKVLTLRGNLGPSRPGNHSTGRRYGSDRRPTQCGQVCL